MSKIQINNMSGKKAYEEVRHILDKDLEGKKSSSEIDLTAACDESVETTRANNTESGNEFIRSMYRKASVNGNTAPERSNSNIHEEVRGILGEDQQDDGNDSEIDLTAAYDESVETAETIKRESGNELMRGMYKKASENGNATPERITSIVDDIMIIDTVGDRSKDNAPVERTPVRSVKKKKRKLEDLGDDKESKKQNKDFKSTKSCKTFANIGGNEKSLKDVCKLITHMLHPEVYAHFGWNPPMGLLLHGPPGSGKTLLAHAIAGELQLPFFQVVATELVSGVSGESEEQIRHLFEQAVATAPCIVFIDEIDAIAPKRENAQREMERRIVAQLSACMDDLGRTVGKAHVLVIGATNRPDSLDTGLRRPGRFDREIALGIPDEASREKILKVLCRNVTVEQNLDWKFLAKNTPGYVGADLMALTGEAVMVAVNRVFMDFQAKFEQDDTAEVAQKVLPNDFSTVDKLFDWLRQQQPITEDQLKSLYILNEDFNQALKCVQPSAQREGFATVPDVTWDDIGALADIRKELFLSILAPIQHAEKYNAFGWTSPSGVLLCGPPGCGKTLLAKAVANEAGINFISVKGPELLNMYVGESERAVRTCFQRAKHSAPCVIFFDEIDALCPKRSDHGEGGASVRVVNQLLTEMDGVEARKGVFLMAATNRQDIIDPAVLRPGRLDKVLHVGFPSAEDRVDILRALTKNGTRPQLAEDVSLGMIGHDPRLEGYTGADLWSLIKESVAQAIQEFFFGHDSDIPETAMDTRVHLRHFHASIEKIQPSVSEKERQYYMAMKTRK